jgi:hypothetical protein
MADERLYSEDGEAAPDRFHGGKLRHVALSGARRMENNRLRWCLSKVFQQKRESLLR